MTTPRDVTKTVNELIEAPASSTNDLVEAQNKKNGKRKFDIARMSGDELIDHYEKLFKLERMIKDYDSLTPIEQNSLIKSKPYPIAP